MAKKLVRGITDIKTINDQDFDTNNVNDLLSDGVHNYIHRKKGKTEEYHNLTDNLKTLTSDNTDLLTITNDNETTNSATLHPKHDSQKEQSIASTRGTITIEHGTNGTSETTKVDTNPQKVLEHENLISNSEYVTINHESDSNTSVISTSKLEEDIASLNTKYTNITKITDTKQAIFVPSKDGLPWFDKTRLTINFNCITDSCYVTKGHYSYALPRGASVKINPSQGSTRAIVFNIATNEIYTSIIFNTSDTNPDLNDNIVIIGTYRISNDGTYNWSFPILTLDNPQHNKHMLPKFGAHRGMCKYAPESSKSAYYLATLYGFDVWEGDVRLTSDNVPVIFHDDIINSYATMPDGTEIPTTVKISETTYNELREYDFGVKKHTYYTGEKILSFNDFCRCMRLYNCKEAHIEFKYDNTWTSDKVEIVKNIADSERVTDKIVFSSFHPENGLAQLYALDNNVRLEYVVDNLSLSDSLIRDFNTTYSNAKELGISFSAINSTANGYFATRAINNNFKMTCWVVNNQNQFSNMIGLPIDLVLTDGWVGVNGLNIV